MHGECVSISCRNRERERERERKRERRNGKEERKMSTTTIMRIQVAHTHSYIRTLVSLSLYRLLTQFLAFLRPFLSLYFASYAQFLQPTTSLRPLLLLLLLFFCCCRRHRRCRFVLFAFCLFSRLRCTGSLHSRAPRVEGPRQGKPVSRVRA